MSTRDSVILDKAPEKTTGTGEELFEDDLELELFGTGEVEDGSFNCHKRSDDVYGQGLVEMPIFNGIRANLATIAAVAEQTRIRAGYRPLGEVRDSVRAEYSKSESLEGEYVSVVDTRCPPERPRTGPLFRERDLMISGSQGVDYVPEVDGDAALFCT